MRRLLAILISLSIALLSGCGYHTLGSATHLPANVKTLAIPLFATHTNTYNTDAVFTTAVLHEFTSRTQLRILPHESNDADAVLHGTILQEVATPLTYNS